jgi:hypothetical protein
MQPTYPDGGRVAQLLRGGSWNNNPRNCRSAYRNHNQPDNANNNVGFRVVCLPSTLHRQNRCKGFQRAHLKGHGPKGPDPLP